MRVTLFFLQLISILGCTKKMDPPAELPGLTVETLMIEEGDQEKPVYLRLLLEAPPAETARVFVSSENGTAEANSDYVSFQNQEIVFQPGDQIEELKIDVLGDKDFETDEEFTVKVESLTGARILVGEAKVTLLNDDTDTTNSTVLIPTTGYSTPETYPGMTLIWQDEFSGNELDTDWWSYEIGTGNNGWGNNESQYYRSENTFTQDGHLIIEARKENFAGREYTSSRLITKGKFDFQYGRVDIRAALPYGQGVWPALWMLGDNISSVGWPSCGEIDIMELLGQEPNRVYGAAHWSNAGQHTYIGGNIQLSSGNFYNAFHVFSIEWNAQEIRWFVDDQHFYTLPLTPAEMSEFHANFFFLFNIAVGGNWPGYPDATTIFPQRMIVDYIRVFQED